MVRVGGAVEAKDFGSMEAEAATVWWCRCDGDGGADAAGLAVGGRVECVCLNVQSCDGQTKDAMSMDNDRIGRRELYSRFANEGSTG
jgi:hypothetical protein